MELADSLDSGSSVHYARAGSSPASRTKRDILSDVSFFISSFLDAKDGLKTDGYKKGEDAFVETFLEKHREEDDL